MDPITGKKRGIEWSQSDMKNALDELKKGLISERAAALKYNIPRRTLKNHIKSGSTEKRLGRKSIFTEAQEKELVEKLKRLPIVSLTSKQIRRQAFLFCKEHNIRNCFSNEKSTAGQKWLRHFLERNKDISGREARFINPEIQKVKPVERHENPELQFKIEVEGCRLTGHRQPGAKSKDTVKKSPLQADSDSDASDSETAYAADNADPLSQDGRPQCRFCGEFTKHFVDTDSELSYVTDNKTSLSVNGINVEIDFNDQAPKTVCVHCNKKLKEMLDFVKLVKFAQDNLIDLGAENRELLIIKTEYDSNDDDDDKGKDKDETNEGEIDTAENSGFGETSTCKRKSNKTTASKRKKTKVEETEGEESNFLIDIKEEVMTEEYTDEPETSTNVIVKFEPDINDVTIETDNGNDANEDNGTNNTNLGLREEKAEPPDQASELEMATRTLLNELGGDGTDSDQGHYG